MALQCVEFNILFVGSKLIWNTIWNPKKLRSMLLTWMIQIIIIIKIFKNKGRNGKEWDARFRIAFLSWEVF